MSDTEVNSGDGAAAPEVLWRPSDDTVAGSNLTRYTAWLADDPGATFAGYDDLWRWSVEDLDAFWSSIWSFFGVSDRVPSPAVVRGTSVEHAVWFPGRA